MLLWEEHRADHAASQTYAYPQFCDNYRRFAKQPKRSMRPVRPVEPEVRFETAMGEQLRVDWVEFRKGAAPLHAFCATMDIAGPVTSSSSAT